MLSRKFRARIASSGANGAAASARSAVRMLHARCLLRVSKRTCFQHEAAHSVIVRQEACAQQEVQGAHRILRCEQRCSLRQG